MAKARCPSCAGRLRRGGPELAFCKKCRRYARVRDGVATPVDADAVWDYPAFVTRTVDPDAWPKRCAACGGPATRFVDSSREVGPDAKWLVEFAAWWYFADLFAAVLHNRIDTVATALPHCDAHAGGGAMVDRRHVAVRSYRFWQAADGR